MSLKRRLESEDEYEYECENENKRTNLGHFKLSRGFGVENFTFPNQSSGMESHSSCRTTPPMGLTRMDNYNNSDEDEDDVEDEMIVNMEMNDDEKSYDHERVSGMKCRSSPVDSSMIRDLSLVRKTRRTRLEDRSPHSSPDSSDTSSLKLSH
jgi:hypothetical protein